jgi:geranylgeranyl reductase family protein
MKDVRDVIVVGGGPAGSATAIFLKRRGHDVLLLDEARFPRDKVCGEGISPESWRLLGDLGAASAVRALRPHPLRGMTVVAPDGTSFTGEYGPDREPGFALPRASFDHALLDRARAAGVEVREKTRATDLLFEDGRVAGVAVENGAGPEQLRARLVVGADGRRSLVARRLGLLREHPRWRKFAVRGYWEGMEGLGEHGEMHVGGGGYCGIAPLSPTVANVTFVLDRGDLARAAGDLKGFYRRMLARWPRILERLDRAQLLGPPRAIGPLALEAKRLSAPGALLVGDSAGFYDPFTGEGVTLALRSAEIAAPVLDRVLRAGRPGDLTDYDRLRGAATRDKFRLNRLIQGFVAWPALANAVARRLARRPDAADRLVGIAGDFIPARTAFDAAFVWDLLRA